ncbi:hypothetical protein BC829DRAFT_214593 [Chytridium lagenaria]|nr:hypothetical protein BC829DRAFT_214593 [Chytridium lagenaria]
MVWDTYVPALVCALLLLVVNGATSNPLLADLVEPDLKPPTCLTNPNKYGWEGFQNFTRAKRPIIIEQAGWDSARIASRIMQIMLSEVMGFRVKYQEFQGGVAATVPRLKAQNVVDVAMELWATPDGAWQNFGSLGYQGRSGLYVPSSLVDAYPELSIDFWRFMQSPIARNLFVKSGEGPEIRTADGGYVCDNVLRGCQKGRYFPSWYKESEANNFIEIWSPFPGWSKWRYERLIDGLKLNATIRWLGNDHDNIVAAYLKNNSAPGIIFYSW